MPIWYHVNKKFRYPDAGGSYISLIIAVCCDKRRWSQDHIVKELMCDISKLNHYLLWLYLTHKLMFSDDTFWIRTSKSFPAYIHLWLVKVSLQYTIFVVSVTIHQRMECEYKGMIKWFVSISTKWLSLVWHHKSANHIQFLIRWRLCHTGLLCVISKLNNYWFWLYLYLAHKQCYQNSCRAGDKNVSFWVK